MRPCIDRQASAPLAHYVVVRADLPHGLQVAQVVHAAGESAGGPVPPGTIAVALSARDEAHLERVSVRLAAAGVRHARVVEGDGPHAGRLMSIGCAPTVDRDQVRRAVSDLPLVR